MTAEDPDPERLLAEALRAQVVRTPMPAPPQQPPPDQPLPPLLSGAEPGYGLLSGHENTVRGPATPYQERGTEARYEPGTTRLRSRPRQLAAGWVLLFALLLGLAAGVAVALLTVY